MNLFISDIGECTTLLNVWLFNFYYISSLWIRLLNKRQSTHYKIFYSQLPLGRFSIALLTSASAGRNEASICECRFVVNCCTCCSILRVKSVAQSGALIPRRALQYKKLFKKIIIRIYDQLYTSFICSGTYTQLWRTKCSHLYSIMTHTRWPWINAHITI